MWFVFEPLQPVIMVLCAVVGLVYGPIQPIYICVIQTRAARRRVVGVMTSLAYAAGRWVCCWPVLTDAAGLHATFLALALPIIAPGPACDPAAALRERIWRPKRTSAQ